jgi:hypothetical protein
MTGKPINNLKRKMKEKRKGISDSKTASAKVGRPPGTTGGPRMVCFGSHIVCGGWNN